MAALGERPQPLSLALPRLSPAMGAHFPGPSLAVPQPGLVLAGARPLQPCQEFFLQ